MYVCIYKYIYIQIRANDSSAPTKRAQCQSRANFMSCKSNMADRIKAHNKILNQETSQSITDSDQEKCNCRQKECPLNGKCLTTAIVYQATVQYDGKTAKYIGLTEGALKPVTEITLNPSNILSTKQKPSYQNWCGH